MHARDLFDWGEKTTAEVNFCVHFDGGWVGVYIAPSRYPEPKHSDFSQFQLDTNGAQGKCKTIPMNIGDSKYVEIRRWTGVGDKRGGLEFNACEDEKNGEPHCDAKKRRYIPATPLKKET